MFRLILSQSPQTFVLANVKLNYYCSKPRGFSGNFKIEVMILCSFIKFNEEILKLFI